MTEEKVKKPRGRPRKVERYMDQTTTFVVRIKKTTLERFQLVFTHNKEALAEDGKSYFMNGVIQELMEQYAKDKAI